MLIEDQASEANLASRPVPVSVPVQPLGPRRERLLLDALPCRFRCIR